VANKNIFEAMVVQEKSAFDINQLADRLRRRNTGWTIPEAFLGILISAAMADGGMGVAEQETILHLASRSRALNAVGPSDLARINETVNERFVSRPDALQEACDTLPVDMGMSVFAHCVDILLADGQLVPSEAAFLEELVQRLSLDAAKANQITEALFIKAQY